ncbi:ribokinase [Klebsiella pneumoniae]|nr:ribokinase [Klebsiella pneumoniae]
MKNNITVVGGLYREISPKSDFFLGSGGRAALFLAEQNIDVKFITCATTLACKSFQASKRGFISSNSQIEIINQETESDISFEYSSYLFDPLIIGYEGFYEREVNLDNCLYFGMLNANIKIKATNKVVYDPQNTSQPKKFNETGSDAGELAIVLNEHEAKAMVGSLETSDLIRKVKEVNGADIVVLKRGPYGAQVLVNDEISDVPLFLSNKFNKIGSGDIFSACFAFSWIIENLDPIEAALKASKAVSVYVETQKYENLSIILDRTFIELDQQNIARKIYLAGPFFSISELWLVEKIKAIFELYNIEVFSPYHAVGVSNNSYQIAQADLQGLENADTIFAISNNFDPGTIFEIGYARALKKNVFMYLNYAAKKDLTMFEGTGCVISDVIDFLIYRAIWNK